ncbi:MAG: hypothetical protein Q7S36_00530 [Candidatus Liptonbacteria bacterium]|nr:hypothetical protein [Candidatus Liptonbacteria bacterium]
MDSWVLKTAVLNANIKSENPIKLMSKIDIQKIGPGRKFADRTTRWLGSISSLIAHSIFFALAFLLIALGTRADEVLLVLTTVVSLEAIYFSIFIQMSVNRATENLEAVSGDVEEIQEGVKELGEEVEDISEDIDTLQEDSEEEGATDEKQNKALEGIELQLQRLLKDVEALKK